MFSCSVLELFVCKNVTKVATKDWRFYNACGKFSLKGFQLKKLAR